ncbi:primosomal protein [Candidatus Bathyarchaeota archaeon]|jgi:hypothetical protein|nr:primosomal protein [Candidatus Bathyarchaeota archaeon]
MSTQHLLHSWTPFDINTEMIKESRDSHDGKIILRGILQKADTLNQNGRVYPKAILEREVRNYQKFIRERRALGECDHPDSSVVELKNTSHLIVKAWMEGNDVYGDVELLNTPAGKILQSLVESGVTLGISSRGVGSTRRDGDRQIVQEDFQLICWDFVSEPSTPGAFMMREGRQITEREAKALKQQFRQSDRVDRLFNDILRWN